MPQPERSTSGARRPRGHVRTRNSSYPVHTMAVLVNIDIGLRPEKREPLRHASRVYTQTAVRCVDSAAYADSKDFSARCSKFGEPAQHSDGGAKFPHVMSG